MPSSIKRVGIGARYEEGVTVRVGGTNFLILVKAPVTPGFPRREIEILSLTAAENVDVGSYYYNARPLRLDVLQQDFFLVSRLATSGQLVRLYWNPVTLTLARDIKEVDVDVSTGKIAPGTAVRSTGFQGIDPFVMDARVGPSHRLYIVYAKASGQNAFRQSFNLGATWGGETVFDPQGGEPTVIGQECNFNDPLGDKEDVQVLQQRNT